jgi:hypothetical protein
LTDLVLWEVLTSVWQFLDFSKKPPLLDIFKKSRPKNPLILGILKNQNERTIWFWVFQKKIGIKEPVSSGYFNNSRIKEL